MYKIFNFFNDIQIINELFNKQDLPVEFVFKDNINSGIKIIIEILIEQKKYFYSESKIKFQVRLFKNTRLVDVSELNSPSLDDFLKQYRRFVNEYNVVENSNKIKMRFSNNFIKFVKLDIPLFKKNFINYFVLPGSIFDIYTVNEYDNKHISRTVMNYLDRINIINTEIVGNFFFIDLHKINMILIDSILQNRVSLLIRILSSSAKIIINFFRFWILFGGFIFNVYFNLFDYNFYYRIISIFVPIILWFVAPKIIRYLIKKILRNYLTLGKPSNIFPKLRRR
jgi:hypothetical protein